MMLRLFCFVFVFLLSLSRGPAVDRSSFFDTYAPRQSHVFLPFPLIFILRRCRFFRVFLYHYLRSRINDQEKPRKKLKAGKRQQSKRMNLVSEAGSCYLKQKTSNEVISAVLSCPHFSTVLDLVEYSQS